MGQLESVLKNINKQYKSDIANIGPTEYRVEQVPFSSPRLNYMLYGGVPTARLVEFSGDEGSGKTTTALDVVGNFQRYFSDKRVVFFDCENTLDTTWAEKLGVNVEELVIIKPEEQTAEQIFDMCLELIDTGEISLVVLDSLGVLLSAQAYSKTMEEKTYGGIASSLTLFSKKAVNSCARTNCTFIGINQMRDDMNSMYGGVITTGGRAWKHNCFSGNTKFVTDKGLKRFRDFKDGESVTVLDFEGNLREATVHYYGPQLLQRVKIHTPNLKFEVLCTPDHRWLLSDGNFTENLSVGDKLYYRQENINHKISSKRQAEMFCMGMVLADGCDYKVSYKNRVDIGVKVVLCEDKIKYSDIFIKAGYRQSKEGKYTAFYKLHNSKQKFLDSECWKYLNPEDNRYLFMGYYSGDGYQSSGTGCITVDSRILNFIKYTSSLAGYFITKISQKTFPESSYNPGNKFFEINFTTHTNKYCGWVVESIKTEGVAGTYCVEEPITQTFTLEKGIVTGNCSLRLQFRRGSYIDADGKDVSRACENPAGNIVQCSVVKSKVSRPDRKIGFYTLKYLTGIDYVSDTIDVAIKAGYILAAGAWYTLLDPETGEILKQEDGKDLKFQGRNAVREYLENNRKFYGFLNNAIQNLNNNC